jgi:hypothetical protein
MDLFLLILNLLVMALPNGTFPNFTGSCHAINSRAITTGLLGNTTATINTTNGVFTDPCGGTIKDIVSLQRMLSLFVQEIVRV